MIVLTDRFITGLTDSQLMEAVLKEYADPENWIEREKDMIGTGQMSVLPPVCDVDRGAQARRCLEIINMRKNK